MAVQSYQEKEQSLYADLSTLIKDASWLRHYMASALRVQGEALSGAARALGDTRVDASVDVSSLSLGSQGAGNGGGGGDGSIYASGGSHVSNQGITPPSAMGTRSREGASNPFLASGIIGQ